MANQLKSIDQMKYLGVLGILCEASPHVSEEIRESIETALCDAEREVPGLFWKRTLDRFDIGFRKDAD